MTEYSELSNRVLRVLSDPGADNHGEEIVYDGICAGLDAVLPWFSSRKVHEIAGDGISVSFALPSDMYEIDAIVLRDTGEILPSAMLAPGVIRGPVMAGVNDWLEYPYGNVLFSKAIGSGYYADVYYRAHWDKPENSQDDTFELTIPKFLEMPVSVYAAAYCLIPKAVESGVVRQYNTRIDSGNPEDNPMQDRVNFLLKLFGAEMNRHPLQSAGSRI